MKRQCLAFLCALLFILAAFPLAATAGADAIGKCGANVSWRLDGDILTIFGVGAMDDYTSADQLPPWSGYEFTTLAVQSGVTGIGAFAFDNCTSLRSVFIGSGVTRIANNAFYKCRGLTRVTIPGNVTAIGNYAFSYCDKMTTATLEEGVVSIGSYAFSHCEVMTDITIPTSVESIGINAFLSASVVTIHGYAGSATEAYAKANEIPFVAFENLVAGGTCGTRLTWKIEGDTLTVSGTGDMTNYTSDKPAPWNRYAFSSLVIEDGVTTIGDMAFYGCTGLTSVTIPGGVTKIGAHAFYGCTGLTSVTIPGSVTEIDGSAFSGCTGLTGITIPGRVDFIGDGAFYGCTGLTSVSIPNRVFYIGEFAFLCCTGLTDITVAADNQYYASIDGVLFNKDKTGLLCYPAGKTGAYTIPDSVTFIGDDAFSDCTGLTGVTIPDSVFYIGDYAFYDCTGLTSITIPDSVTDIRSYAFDGCENLTICGYTGTVAEEYAREYDIRFEAIGAKAVSNNVAVLLPVEQVDVELVAEIDEEAVAGLPEDVRDKVAVYEIHLELDGETVQPADTVTVKLPVPEGVDKEKCRVYHVDGEELVDMNAVYQNDYLVFTTDHFSLFAVMEEMPAVTPGDEDGKDGVTAEGTCGDNLTWKIEGDTLTISGEGEMKDEERPWYEYDFTTVIIESGVTSVGYRAFYDCTGLTSVTIPDSVTGIGDSAFSNCTGLTSVTIPDSVTGVGDYAFSNCTGLTSVSIGNSVTGIGDYAFYYCTGLTEIAIPDSVTSIGNSALAWCEGLTSVSIGNSVTSIGDDAFSYCTGLTSITIPDSVTSIGGCAFSRCTGLTSVSIGNSVTSIGKMAFWYCTGLTGITVAANNPVYTSIDGVSFTKDKTVLICYPAKKDGAYAIPDSVTSIGDYAFSFCAGLTEITIPDSVTSIGDYAFSYCTGLTGVTIPDSVTGIGDYAFYYCAGLTEIAIPDSVTGIGNYAFWGCEDLTICGYTGSVAEAYADENDISFAALYAAVTPGDVDGKDGVTAADALMALQAATGKIDLTGEQETAADVDDNGDVTAADALAILQFATGKITAF